MTFIANNIYGSVHDYKLIYKEEILKHIKTLSSENQKKRINFENTLYVSNILTQVEALMSEIYKSFANIKYEQVIDDLSLIHI